MAPESPRLPKLRPEPLLRITPLMPRTPLLPDSHTFAAIAVKAHGGVASNADDPAQSTS